MPEHILASWREAGARHRATYEAWSKAASRLDASARAGLTDPIDAGVKAKIEGAIGAAKSAFSEGGRQARDAAILAEGAGEAVPVVPGLVGGSADLTGSNGTLTKLHSLVKPGDFGGTYIHYGVREHGMAAAMNGLALHGGIVPYGGTFLVFSDYCRPSIRLAAMMGQRVIYVMTHDSIGLGEDGPTHQPVEQLAALRAMPNLNVMRPADSVECAECWEIALLAKNTPSILALTRQGVPLLRNADTQGEPVGQGRLCADRDGREARRDADRHGLRVSSCSRGGREACRAGDQGRCRVDALLGAVRSSRRGLSERGPGLGPTRRRRGGCRVRLVEMARGRRAPSSACTDSGLLRLRKTYISISASRRRPWQSAAKEVIARKK